MSGRRREASKLDRYAFMLEIEVVDGLKDYYAPLKISLAKVVRALMRKQLRQLQNKHTAITDKLEIETE